jgi:hypothetical protein
MGTQSTTLIQPMPFPQSLRSHSHPWLTYLPSQQRFTTRLQRRLLMLRSWLAVRRHQIQLLLVFYLLTCLAPLALGLVTLTAFAILPLLLVPPLGGLIYWLVWKEFHH